MKNNKKLHKITLNLAIALLVLGVVFKIQHWKGAGTIISVSVIIAFMYLILQIISRNQATTADEVEEVRKFDLRRTILITILCILYLAVLFKIQHWKGAGLMLLISLSSLSIYFIYISILIRKYWFAVIPFLFAIAEIGALFKIQHWYRPVILDYFLSFHFIISIGLISIFFFQLRKKLTISHEMYSKATRLFYLSMLFILMEVGLAVTNVPFVTVTTGLLVILILIYSIILVNKFQKRHLSFSTFKAHLEMLRLVKLIYFLAFLGIPASVFMSLEYKNNLAHLVDKSIFEKTDSIFNAPTIKIPYDELKKDSPSYIYETATIINEKSDSLVNYILHLQDSLSYYVNDGIIQQTLNKPSDQLSVKKLLIQNKHGDSLFKYINDFQSYLNSIDSNSSVIQFNYSVQPYFENTPAIAAKTILSKIQNDVRISQTNVINFLVKKLSENDSIK